MNLVISDSVQRRMVHGNRSSANSVWLIKRRETAMNYTSRYSSKFAELRLLAMGFFLKFVLL